MQQPEINREEFPSYLEPITLAQVLSDENFSNIGESVMSGEVAENYVMQRYPNFNFKGQDSEDRKRMQSFAAKLASATREVKRLEEEGKKTESYILSRKIKLIGDPSISRAESGIAQLLDATHGNYEMAMAFLGVRDIENGKQWVNFIVRTWGQNSLNSGL